MKYNQSILKLLTYSAVLLIGVASINANSFRRDKTNTSSNPGWPMNQDESAWPPGVPRTWENADSINAHHQQLIAERYAWTTNGDPKYIDAIKALKPSFRWCEYNSFQDNYVSSGDTDEHDYLVAQCQAMGINPERLYLHYWDATTISLQSTTLTLPGLANARTLQDTINSRLPVYYANRSRIAVNYSDPITRTLVKKFVCNRMTNIRTQGTYTAQNYIDGVFFDNTQPAFWNHGSVVSGGHVAEAPGRTRVDSIGNRGTNWWWSGNMLPFFNELMDTLDISSSWSKDGKPKFTVLNTSGTIYDPMATNRIGHNFGHEGGYSPMRTYTGSITEVYRYDSLCAANGVCVVYANPIYTSVSGAVGTYSYQEAIHHNLCLFYITSSDSAWFSPLGSPGPWDFGWDTLVWVGSMDYDVGPHNLADKKFGIHTTGTDPRGYAYTIFTRNYPRVKVFLRTRGSYNQDVDATTTVTINLGGSYREIRPDGTLGPIVTSATFRNAQGRMFAPATGTGDGTPPSPVQDLSAIAGPTNGTIALEWTAPGDDDNTGTASAYSIKYSTLPLTEASWNSAPSYGNPPAPQAGGSAEQLVLTGLGVGQRYYLGVRAIDDQGNMGGLSNEAISFSKGIAAPNLDTVLVLKTTREVVLKTDPVSAYYQIRVEFQLDTDNSFASAQTFVDDTPAGSPQVTIPNLVDNQLYYWRARSVATDDSNASNWSTTGSFRPSFTIVTGDDETKVIVVGGSDLVTFSSPRPTLSVQNLLFGSNNQYFFDVATDDNFDAIIASSSAIPEADNGVTSWQVPDKLSSGITYYWHARANDYPYSNTATFVVDLQAHPFPNPVNLNSGTPLTFTNLPSGKNLVIMTVSGEVVRRWTDLSGADLTWDGKNESGSKIAAGTYLWFIEDSEMKGKLIVIR